ncbi:queuine tRNA-ribosyltransferase accessory subunit 2, partial [Sipha flava]
HGLNKFVGLENYLSCCSTIDSVLNTPRGKNQKDKVSLKTKSGNILIDYEKYMDIIEVFKPNMYVTLSISDTDWDSSYSLIEKSVNISNRLFMSCLERHHKSEVLKGSGVIAPIQGGYNIQERIRSATFLSEYNDLLGFLFDGFFTDGTVVEDIPGNLILPIVNKTMECLPKDKMKIIFGAWTLDTIIDLINSGMDIFDSSLPFFTTERNSALIFNYELKYKNDIIIMDSHCCTTDQNNVDKSNSFEICLMDTCYFEDFNPINESCSCLACRKHTRAYIHHLLMSNELLGSLLLTIHNLHYFHQFFKDIREVLLKNNQ